MNFIWNSFNLFYLQYSGSIEFEEVKPVEFLSIDSEIITCCGI